MRHPRVPLDQRAEAIGIAKQWLDGGGDARAGLEVLAAAVHPAIFDSYSDPGEGNTFTLVAAVYPPDALQRISVLWDHVLDAIDDRSFPTYEPLLSVLHVWVFPDTAQLGTRVDLERRRIARATASRVVDRLSRSLAGNPGPLSTLKDLARSGGLEVHPIDVPAEFDSLFPDRDPGGDFSIQKADMINRVKDLASQWLSLGPQELANRISFAEQQASKVGRTWPRFTPQLCEHLAGEYANPAVLLHDLDALDVPPDLIAPLLVQLVRKRASSWSDEIHAHLENPGTRFVTVHICLTEPVGAELQATAIALMNSRYRNLIDMLAIRHELDETAIRPLINHSDAEVSRVTAVAVWRDRPIELSEETIEKCRETLIKSDGGSHDDFWFWHILKADPSLLEDWTREWISRNVSANGSYLPHDAVDAIRALPLSARLRLLKAVPDSARSFFLGELISALVGEAEEAFVLLLSRPSLADYARDALGGFPDKAWARKAVIAHRSGMSAREVAGACLPGLSGWSGNESEHWDQYVQAFTRLRGEPELSAIADAGVEGFSRMRNEARAREHGEAVFGFDDGGP